MQGREPCIKRILCLLGIDGSCDHQADGRTQQFTTFMGCSTP